MRASESSSPGYPPFRGAETVHGRSLLIFAAILTTSLRAQGEAPPAPQVTVGGLVYTQYQYTDAPVHTNTFDVTRAYVNVLGRFANGISTRLTTDIIPSAVTNQAIRLKYAYVAWTPTGSNLTYKLGMIHTPYVDFEETLWDYRMQGTIAVDRNGYMTAADIGAGVDGHWKNEQLNGQLVIVNGEGYSGGTGDFRKDLEARVSVRLQPTNDATASAACGSPATPASARPPAPATTATATWACCRTRRSSTRSRANSSPRRPRRSPAASSAPSASITSRAARWP